MNRKEAFVEGEIYHIFNRGVEKRKIFMSDGDFDRFLYNLVEFNDTEPSEHVFYKPDSYEVGPRKNRVDLVEILAYCLIDNHYHLLLQQKTENGITEFMRKLGTGYTMYFNKKYERVGPLFQGKFKSVLIGNEQQSLFIPHYIHLNALDLLGKDEKSLMSEAELVEVVKEYPRSSIKTYINETRDSILSMSAIQELYSMGVDYEQSLFEMVQLESENFLRGPTS